MKRLVVTPGSVRLDKHFVLPPLDLEGGAARGYRRHRFTNLDHRQVIQCGLHANNLVTVGLLDFDLLRPSRQDKHRELLQE